jgi:hypothetical protein
MGVPKELKHQLINDLPAVLEQVDEATKKIYDPTQIWLESMQFADYVTQLASHILDGHDEQCVLEVGEQLTNMSNSFKQMGENALRVLDEVEKEESCGE